MIVSRFPFRFVLASALAAATLPFHATAQEAPKRMPAPIVYFDIAGPADAGQTAFYEKVCGAFVIPGSETGVYGPLYEMLGKEQR